MKSAGSSALGRKAVAHLRKVDPVLGRVIDKVGVYKGWPASNGTHFDAVARFRVPAHARFALARAEAAKPAYFDFVAHPQ